MSKHTPGPWHIANGCQIRSSKDQIAKAWMMRGGEGLANARLISAAPELLEALEDAVQYLQHHLPCDALAPHLAAIAKARGN